MLILDLSLDSDLKDLILEGPVELELGLYEGPLALSDPLRFHALQRALDHYKWPEDVVLFRQKGPLAQLIRPFDRLERFAEWQADHPYGDEELFARDLLVGLLQLLMPSFPEETKLSVILEQETSLRVAHPSCWSGLVALGEGNEAILLPPQEEERPEPYETIVRFGIKRYVPQENLPLFWEGVDRIYVTQEINNQVLRSLKGFEAAGGEVIFL